MTFGAAHPAHLRQHDSHRFRTAYRVRSSLLAASRSREEGSGDRRHRHRRPPVVLFQQGIHFAFGRENARNWSLSFSSSSCSPRIFISSSLARWRSSCSRIASVRVLFRCRNATSARVLARLQLRIISITSSMLRNATSKPSRICRRLSTFSRR